MNNYIKKKESYQINSINTYLKELEEQTKPKVIRRKKTAKIRAEIKEVETRKIIEIRKTKRCFKKKRR